MKIFEEINLNKDLASKAVFHLKRSRHSCIVSRNKPVFKKKQKKNLSVEFCVYDIKRK